MLRALCSHMKSCTVHSTTVRRITLQRHSARNNKTPHGSVVVARASSTSRRQGSELLVTLCVEGNISAGKSTFLSDIIAGSQHLKDAGTTVALEPVDKWQRIQNCAPHHLKSSQQFNILDEFYEAPDRYAYTFQHYVFMTRYLQEIESRSSNSDALLRIMERSVFSDKMVFVESVHEKGWMSDLEFSLFNSWYEPMVQVSPNLVPDGFIYLRTSAETCMRRLRQRARGEETGVGLEYLQTLHDKHEAWLCPEKPKIPSSGAHDRAFSPDVPDIIFQNVHYVNDERVVSLKGVPVLVLDYDEDLELASDEHSKERYRKMVEAYVGFVRQKMVCVGLQRENKTIPRQE